GAGTTMVPVGEAYLEVTPSSAGDGPPPAGPGRRVRPLPEAALPRATVRLLDTESRVVRTVSPGSRAVVEVSLDGLGGQLAGTRLAGVAGFQLWLGGRQVAGVPTAVLGPGVGGVYQVGLSTRSLRPGRQSVELRVFSAEPGVAPLSVLTSWQLG
ncbi:MAG TPA: hypothetical protein VGD67_27035, partial [Pseudonocardiaceae bacterium]